MEESTENPIVETCSCQRCEARCRVSPPGNPKAKMLRLSAKPKGLCVNCAVHDFLRNTYPCNMLLDESGPTILLHPSVREEFAEIMRVLMADAKPDELNWNLIVENWELPFAEKVKRSGMNPYVPGKDRPLGKGVQLIMPNKLRDGDFVIHSFDELDALAPGSGAALRKALHAETDEAPQAEDTPNNYDDWTMFKKRPRAKRRCSRRSITPRPKEGTEMAKRTMKPMKPSKLRQTMIPGTIDEPPKEVREAADTYVAAKRSVAKLREKMNGALTDLIEKMKAADVHEILIDDGKKRLILTEKDQVKIKARKKSKDDPEK